jgi:transposase
MAIVAGFDVHRAQITYDVLDQETGEVKRGRIRATPQAVREWAGRFAEAELHVAVEACTGWLFVCEALVEASAVVHLAEPVETSALRGTKRRAKTDREDARWLRHSAVAPTTASRTSQTSSSTQAGSRWQPPWGAAVAHILERPDSIR